MNTTVAKADFQRAMASFAAGITAITTQRDGCPIGIIATSVCSLSADPPSIIVCVNKDSSVHDAILQEGRFAVNLLSVAHRDVVQRFQSHKGDARFEPEIWASLETGAPILVNAAVALDCELLDRHDGYSHSIIVGGIKATLLADSPNAACLLWHDRAYACSVPLPQ